MEVAVGARMAASILTLLFLASWCLMSASGFRQRGMEREEEEEAHGGGRRLRGRFLLARATTVARTDAGEIRVASRYPSKSEPCPMHIGFIQMEPNSLVVPQYIDANLVLFVHTGEGEVKVGWIHKDELVERKMRRGDVNVIPAGSTFYIVNTHRGDRSQMICSIDTTQSMGVSLHQSFFVGGGMNPTSVLAGFDSNTLAAAFNVTAEELERMMRSQSGGAIVYMRGESTERPDIDDDNDDGAWTKQKLVDYLLGKVDRKKAGNGEHVGALHSYNLYDNEPSYRNSFGWTTAIDEDDYSPLRSTGVGVYVVNLTAGSMLAPHMNPMATEYGVVLGGSGTIQVVFPNGSNAMNAEVSEGDAFWIPQYFPFCQIASSGAPMEFFGFTTSSRRNHPQFLVGASSVLRSMRGRELAAAFRVSEERLERLVKAQRESVILPVRHHQLPEEEDEAEEELSKLKRGM
ncbi:Cupin [Musa troglodytarum]|uniref:Cupin n=2 Tax=Musa troglodytarum TaxID=320322 RepID=A0A9E7HDF1_9LILI|nr:Cupin [Musa troglodytarum]